MSGEGGKTLICLEAKNKKGGKEGWLLAPQENGKEEWGPKGGGKKRGPSLLGK